MVEKMLRTVYYDDSKVTSQLMDRYFEMLLMEGNRDGLIGRLNQVRNENSEEIKKIICPTLIMWGDDDQLVRPEDAYKFEADILGSQLIMYENMGHVPMEEIPEQTVSDFRKFLEN
jgi:pimeloyl-ACP methyl ester carboxylesterase